MYSPQQFSSVPPPSSISNLPGFQQAQPQHPTTDPGTFASIFGPNPVPAQLPNQHANFNPALNYPNTSFAPQTPIIPEQSHAAPSLQTYTTYPQQQGTSVTTPLTLPGLPPITVSATIPPEHQFTTFAHPAAQQHPLN